jgi:hypothetical protein
LRNTLRAKCGAACIWEVELLESWANGIGKRRANAGYSV